MEARFGKFEIDQGVLEDHPEIVRTIMSQCLVTRCEHDYAHKAFNYEAVVDAFEIVEPGAAIPTYDLEYDAETNTVTWTKKEA